MDLNERQGHTDVLCQIVFGAYIVHAKHEADAWLFIKCHVLFICLHGLYGSTYMALLRELWF